MKMPLNPEVTKQAEVVVYSYQSQNITHPTVYFNNSPVIGSSSQKHLGIHLNEKLNFIHYIKEKKLAKVAKIIVLLKN